jgi:hypothetical protein
MHPERRPYPHYAGAVLSGVLVIVVNGCASEVRLPVPTADFVTPPPPGVGACNSYGIPDPVAGTLELEFGEVEALALIVDADGDRFHVLWPRGYSATSAGDGALLDETGQSVAADGAPVELSHVEVGIRAGTEDDPYVATGIFEGRCYIPAPDRLPDG